MNFSVASQHTFSHSSNAFKSGPVSAAVLSGGKADEDLGVHDEGVDGAVVILEEELLRQL